MAEPERTTINLGAELRKKLKALAIANERSLAAEARLAVAYYVEANTPSRRGRR